MKNQKWDNIRVVNDLCDRKIRIGRVKNSNLPKGIVEVVDNSDNRTKEVARAVIEYMLKNNKDFILPLDNVKKVKLSCEIIE